MNRNEACQCHYKRQRDCRTRKQENSKDNFWLHALDMRQNSSPWLLGAVLLVDWPLEEVLQLPPIDHPTARHQFQIVALLQDQSIRASNMAI